MAGLREKFSEILQNIGFYLGHQSIFVENINAFFYSAYDIEIGKKSHRCYSQNMIRTAQGTGNQPKHRQEVDFHLLFLLGYRISNRPFWSQCHIT